jgi:hypothetical protein
LADDSTVKDLDKLYGQAKTGRVTLEPVWLLNLSYYVGSQWLAWNGRQLFQPSLRPNRITIVDNRIQGVVRTEIAKMTKTRPTFTVVPGSASDEDVNAANLGEQVMRYLWKHLDAQEITTKALYWSRICAAGFVKCYWDSTVGDSTEVLVSSATNEVIAAPGPDGRPGPPMRPHMLAPGVPPGPQRDQAIGQFAQSLGMQPGAIRVKKVSMGDIQLAALSPFQMFPDPLADTFDECEWVIEESVKSKEYVQRRYDVELNPDTPANPGMVEVRLGTFIPGSSPYKGVKIREFWAKPSSQFPTGRRVVWAQGKVLQEDKSPFDCLPYVMFSSIPVPGRLWPTSVTEQLRGPQTELNKVKSQMAENRNRVGNPTVLASRQAVQDPERFADSVSTPGGIYFADASYGPINQQISYLEAPGLPEYVPEEIQRIEESIQEISGQHEVSSAQVPPGVTAASAINLLQEADDTRLGPGITDYENQLAKLGGKILSLVANYYTDERTIRIAGDNGAWQIFPFRGAMLRGNSHVQVQTGSAFPQSKAAKQAALIEILRMLAQMQYQFTPKDLAQFLQDYEIGGAEKLIEQYTRDEQQVNRENIWLAQGKALPINDYDNDQAHVDGHEDFEKSQAFQALSPDIQRVFELHVAAHRERLQQQQQQELQQQLAMSGQVPPNMTAAAFQDAQQLSQLQGHQQMQLDGMQAQQQQQAAAQQQGFDHAAAEQKQRQAEEDFRNEQRRKDELHQHNLAKLEQQRQQAQEQHEARIAQMRQPRNSGGSGGRRAAA